jgi:phage shock protein A
MLTDDDKKWIADQIAASEQRVGARVDARVAASEERMEKIETALLTEFHKWASPVVTRMRSHADALRTLDPEMEALPSRVDKLEKP